MVAGLPSSSPAAASTRAPVHTEVVHSAVRCAARSQSSTAVSAATAVAAGPPGTTTICGAGVSAKVWVTPSASTPLSVTTGPTSWPTKRISVSGAKRSTS
ncbi:Uncharacterised protein [Mycobacteroides abscessus subsp. abscessus]|nr:Uncharacterised protein [Mycobacteroides abscessus subsp. abscessus]